ncbi:MAG: hypothetical protein KDB94_03150 [Acidobacteria bacterium]|nr:hypothetical protein [Acidobacteriota bacterium]MCB9378760.1 hypothetical protein [Holophagales bacterium]
MYREFFAAMDSPVLPLVAMAFFALAFALVLLRTFAWKRNKDYDSVADLPLEDGEAIFRKEVKP